MPAPPEPTDAEEPEVQEQEPSLGELFDWRTKFRNDAVTQIEKWAGDFGYPKFALDAFVRDNIDGAVSHITRMMNPGPEGMRAQDAFSATQYKMMWDHGMTYFSRFSGLPFDGLQTTNRGSGSGSGSRGPTSAQIRDSFDEDQLTEAANKMWGAYLVEDAPNARGIAKGYIDAVVAGRGEKTIDFETFVLERIRKTNRHKLVYRNKPEGASELEYISPYTQAATSVIGGAGRPGGTASDVAAGGAALGASSDAFRDRLARTPQHQQTKGFINGLEQRVRDVKNVLRG